MKNKSSPRRVLRIQPLKGISCYSFEMVEKMNLLQTLQYPNRSNREKVPTTTSTSWTELQDNQMHHLWACLIKFNQSESFSAPFRPPWLPLLFPPSNGREPCVIFNIIVWNADQMKMKTYNWSRCRLVRRIHLSFLTSIKLQFVEGQMQNGWIAITTQPWVMSEMG